MKKFITVAAMAMAFLCVEHSNAGAHALETVEYTLDQGEINPQLAMSILQAASLQVDADVTTLWNKYVNGYLTIVQTEEGWLVSDGGAAILVDENL